MNDALGFTPELTRPQGNASLREQLNAAHRALSEERAARIAAEEDATQMAHYIAGRVNSKVWAHDDVIRVVAAVVSALMTSPLNSMIVARSKGIPPSYSVLAQILTTRATEIHAELSAAFESGELDPNKMASDEMRELLLSRLRIEPDVD